MEVGDIFNPLVKEMYKILACAPPDFPVRILSRFGLHCLLRRPGSNYVSTCWSDSQPSYPIILPVGHCQQGGEA